MRDFYQYPAIFDIADDGISIFFPDLPGCLPCADNMQDAFKNAKEALHLHLYGMEEDDEAIPASSDPAAIKLKQNQTLAMSEAWMPPFREKMANRAMKKTVTIPRWLNKKKEKEKVNYSHLLQNALKEYLGVSDSKTAHFS